VKRFFVLFFILISGFVWSQELAATEERADFPFDAYTAEEAEVLDSFGCFAEIFLADDGVCDCCPPTYNGAPLAVCATGFPYCGEVRCGYTGVQSTIFCGQSAAKNHNDPDQPLPNQLDVGSDLEKGD
jgi:hypothetical protein